MSIRNRHRKRAGLTTGLALVAGLTLAGCAQGTGPAGTGSSGDQQIKLGLIGEFTSPISAYPASRRIVELAVEDLNKSGGINGVPVKVIACDSQGLADQVTRCGREMISAGVSGVLTSTIVTGADKIPPILEPAGIPYFSAVATQEFDYRSDVSYPIVPYVIAVIGASYLQAIEGCENPVAVAWEGPSLAPAQRWARLGARAGEGKEPKWITAPPGTTDYAPLAAQIAAEDPDCLLPYSSESFNSVLFPALEQTGWRDRPNARLIGYQGGVYTQGLLERFPEFLEGTRVVDLSYPLNEPVWDEFNAYTKTLSSENLANMTSSVTKNAFINFTTFVNAMKQVQEADKPTTAASLKEILDTSPSIDTGFRGDFTAAESLGIEQLPNLFNAKYMLEEIIDGEPVMQDGGKWQDFGPQLVEAAKDM